MTKDVITRIGGERALKGKKLKRFAVGANVTVIMPGVNGVVTKVDDEATVFGEYWHTVHTEQGEYREPGGNLELVPEPIGGASMAKRSTRELPKQAAQLTAEEMRAGIDRLQKRLEEVKRFEPESVTKQYDIPHVEKLNAAVEDALVRTFGKDSVDYERYMWAGRIDNGPHNYAFPVPLRDVQETLRKTKNTSIALLEQAIESLQERLAEAGPASVAARSVPAKVMSRKVFVVHGHEEAARESVARFLERLDFDAIILHEQASRGRTVIEKVEAHSDVGFAVVLLTPDDVGCVKGGTPAPRARQNVVLELGYFVGRLGRTHVCALKRGEVEIPSDFDGVVYVDFDSPGAWKQALGRELAAEFEIDWNKVMRP
jgi:predicted nucleotide-binding protein